MAKHVLLLNGPNLNLLGFREPHLYGVTTLSSLESMLKTHCTTLSPTMRLSCFQSNHEGVILDLIHSCHPQRYTFNHDSLCNPWDYPPPTKDTDGSAAMPKVDAIIINPGGLTHTSVVLRDALVAVGIPFVEVHVTNVHARDAFRHQSFLSEKAAAVVCGMGTYGYTAAVEYFARGGK